MPYPIYTNTNERFSIRDDSKPEGYRDVLYFREGLIEDQFYAALDKTLGLIMWDTYTGNIVNVIYKPDAPDGKTFLYNQESLKDTDSYDPDKDMLLYSYIAGNVSCMQMAVADIPAELKKDAVWGDDGPLDVYKPWVCQNGNLVKMPIAAGEVRKYKRVNVLSIEDFYLLLLLEAGGTLPGGRYVTKEMTAFLDNWGSVYNPPAKATLANLQALAIKGSLALSDLPYDANSRLWQALDSKQLFIQ